MERYQFLILKYIQFIFILIFLHCINDPPEEVVSKKPSSKKEKVTVPYKEALYRQNGCEACHGKNGEGNPSKQVEINLRDKNQFKFGYKTKDIMESLKYGIPKIKPSYSHLSDSDRREIAEYVRQLR